MAELSISMPRGDRRKVKFCVRSGETLKTDLTEIFFTVKDSTRRDEFIFQKRFSAGDITLEEDNYFHMCIEPEDTEDMNYATYKFDIEIVKGDEIKQTTVGNLTITDEVTFPINEGE